jgi:zona occludens toxin (predicted ATPase)
MISRRGIELAVSTLIIMVIAIFLLIGLVFFLTGGFSRFKESTEPIIDTTQSISIIEACKLSCTAESSFNFCCKDYKLDDKAIRCTDSRLDINCLAIQCESVTCK